MGWVFLVCFDSHKRQHSGVLRPGSWTAKHQLKSLFQYQAGHKTNPEFQFPTCKVGATTSPFWRHHLSTNIAQQMGQASGGRCSVSFQALPISAMALDEHSVITPLTEGIN